MSITALPAASSNGRERKPDGVRTYRGKTLAELIPQIRAELGPDAIILREREGLIGGVSGFFAKRCVEVEARGAMARVDVYDDEDDEGADDALELMAESDEETGSQEDVKVEVARERRAEVARRAAAIRQRRAEAARAARDAEPVDEPEGEPA